MLHITFSFGWFCLSKLIRQVIYHHLKSSLETDSKIAFLITVTCQNSPSVSVKYSCPK